MKISKSKKMKLRGLINISRWFYQRKNLLVLFFLILFSFSTVYYLGFDRSGVKVAQAAAESCVSAQSGNWNVAATWASCGGGFPGTDDNATILNTHTVTVNVAANPTWVDVNLGGTLSISSGITFLLDVANTSTIDGSTTGLGIFRVNNAGVVLDGSGSITASILRVDNTLTFASTANLSIDNIENNKRFITNNGTVTVTGNISSLGSTSTWTQASGSVLNIAGGFTGVGNVLSASASPNTVNYNGSVAQTVLGATYNILEINNAAGAAPGAATVIGNAGSLNLVSGTFAAGTNLTMTSTSTINISGGSMTGTPQGAGVYNVNYTGNSKTTGTELAGTGLNNIDVSLTSGQTLTLGANATPDGNLSVTTGIFDLSSNTIDRSAAGGTLTLSNGATLKIGGTNSFPTNYSTHTLGATSTVEYSGAAQTVTAETYGDLSFSGSGNKTTAALTTTVAGNWDVGSGTTALLTNNNSIYTVSGNLTGTGSIAQGSGLITVGGDWTNTGTFTASSAGVTLTGASKSITGAAAGITFTTLTVDGTYTNNNATAITVSTALSGSGTLTQATNATLNISGTSGITGLTATASPNTVDYNGAAQTVKAFTYHHLILSNSGTKTLTGLTTVNGDFSLSGTASATAAAGLTIGGNVVIGSGTTFAGGAFTHNIAGNWTNNGGTFTNTGSTINLNGSVAQIIGGSSSTTFNDLTISNTTTGVTASVDTTVDGVLSLSANPLPTKGSLDMWDGVVIKTLNMGASATTVGAGDVTGIVKRSNFVVDNVYTFGNQYATLTFRPGGTLPTDLSMNISIGAAPGWKLGAVKRIYDIKRTGGLGYMNINHLHYLDSELNGNVENTLVIWNGPTPVQEHGRSNYDTVTNWVGISGLPITYLPTTFGVMEWTMGSTMISGATWNGSVSTDWMIPGNWNEGAVPSDLADVIIPGATLNDPILSLDQVLLVGRLTLNSGATIDSVGNYTITISGDSGAWSNNGGTFNAGTGNVVFTNAAATMSGDTQFYDVTINPGATLALGTNTAMRIGGTMTNNGVWNAATNAGITVEYNGAAQNVLIPNGTTPGYDNLILSGSGIKTIQPAATILNVLEDFTMSGATVSLTPSAVMNVTGDFTVGSGDTFTMGAYSNAIGGNLTNSGTFTASGGAIDLGGNFTNNAGATFTGTNGTFTIGGDFTNDSTFTATGSTITFDGTAAQTIGVTINPAFNTLNISNITAAVTATNNFSTTGLMTVISGATFNTGTSVISGGGTFTLASGGTLGIGSTAGITSAGNATGNIQTTVRNFNTGANYTYNGSANQAAGNGLPATVNNLIIDNTGVSGNNIVTISSDQTVSNTLTLTNGLIATGANKVIVSSDNAIARTNGYVDGNLQLHVATGATSKTFTIGDSSYYTPVVVSFGTVGNVGNLLASTTAADHLNLGSSGLSATKYVKRYWTVTSPDALAFNNYGAVFNFDSSDIQGGANPASFIVKKWDGVSWTSTTNGTRNPLNTEATGMISFSDFVVGEAANTAPTGTFNSVAQKTDGSGDVDVSIEVDDAEDNDTKAKIEYETDSDGACDGPWAGATLLGPATADNNDSGGAPDVNNVNPYQVGATATTRIITSAGSNTVQFDWDSNTDLPAANGAQCLRLTVNDDTADSIPATQTLSVDNVAPSAFTVGSVITTGGTVVATKWNSTNTGVDVATPIANDSSLTGGTLQIQAEADGSFENIGSAYTILVGDLGASKTLSILAAALEGITGFSDGDNITFRAIITDLAGNPTTGSISVTSLDVDQTVPSATGTPDMTSGTDLGSSNSDDVTSDTSPDFTVSCESGAMVTLRVDTALDNTGLCAAGTVTITLSAQVGGTYAIDAIQEDAAGNTSTDSLDLSITIDTTNPGAFTTGIVVTTGGTVVATKWNSTNTGVDVATPIANDSSLTGGTLQIQAEADGSFENIGSAYTILVGDLGASKTLSILAAALEGITGFSDGDNITFRAIITDLAGNPTTGSISVTSLDVDQTAPTVTIDQAVGQADPTGTSPINFTAVFNEPTVNFATGDVTLSGTAAPTTAVVTEIAPSDGTTYNVAVSGMAPSGTVIASIDAVKATDAAGNPNNASSSTDNSVTYNVAGGGHTFIYPSVYSVSINNGAASTNSTDVTLNLQSLNAAQVVVSNNSDFIDAVWQAFTSPTTMNWILEPGDGAKTVYVIYKSSDGTNSPVINDSIEFNTAVIPPPVEPPVVPPVAPPVTPPVLPVTPPQPQPDDLNIETPLVTLLIKPGDLIKNAEATVYYYGWDGKRHTFPNRGTFDTWYSNFDQVKFLPVEQLQKLPLGVNVTFKPGVRLIKVTTDPKVYAVDANGTLRWIVNEAVAIKLYGSNWSGLISDVSDAFFTDYKMGTDINSEADFNPSQATASAVSIDIDKNLTKIEIALLPEIIYNPRITYTAVPSVTIQSGACKAGIVFTSYLKLGNDSNETEELQKLLQCLQYFPADIAPSGYFGSVTEAAVKKFQASAGLAQTGSVGPLTREELNKN